MNDITFPPRGFSREEFERRTERAQTMMLAAGLDAILLTTEPEVRYFSGFHTQFWDSPTRPWFLILPLTGKPIAIIPEIGAAGMRETWIDDIRCWSSPDPVDDGISLLAGVLREISVRYGCIGMPMGPESTLRMPLLDYQTLRERLKGVAIHDASPLICALRSIKSNAEIDKIRTACEVASAGFALLPDFAAAGQTERAVCQRLKEELLRLGADASPYLVGASGPGGYDNIIMGPTDRILEHGDVLIVDTGTVFDGYYCDFDRNFAFGDTSDDAKRAYEVVYAATDAGLAFARPGVTHAELYSVMWKVLLDGGALGNDVGRLGHGLGMQLTEGASNMPGDETELESGMVITLEPGMCFAPGKLMVHEENIVIRDGPAELLSFRATPQLPCIY